VGRFRFQLSSSLRCKQVAGNHAANEMAELPETENPSGHF
jgi:hypothetical protein